PLLVLAYIAHALPVLWAIGVLVYIRLARRVGEKKQRKLLLGVLCAIVVMKMALYAAFETRWSLKQPVLFTGADQLWVFDSKYLLASAGAIGMWTLWLRRLKGVWNSVPGQIYIVTAVGVMLLPTRVDLPQYQHALVYVAERMSLALAVCICAVL